MRFFIRRLVLRAAIVVLVGCESPGSVAPYQEATINRFMATCLRDTPVSVCLCLLENTQRQIPESQLSETDAASVVDQQKSRLGTRCAQPLAMSGIRGARSLESPPVTVPVESRPPTTVSSSEPFSKQIVGPIEKPASSIETCTQERILDATLKAKDGAVPIETFDRIQIECRDQS